MSSNALVFLGFFAHAEQSEHGLNASVRAHEPGASAEMSLKEEASKRSNSFSGFQGFRKRLGSLGKSRSVDQSSSELDPAGRKSEDRSSNANLSPPSPQNKPIAAGGLRRSNSEGDSSSESKTAVKVEEPEPRSETDCLDGEPVPGTGAGLKQGYYLSSRMICEMFLWSGDKITDNQKTENLFDSEEECKNICDLYIKKYRNAGLVGTKSEDQSSSKSEAAGLGQSKSVDGRSSELDAAGFSEYGASSDRPSTPTDCQENRPIFSIEDIGCFKEDGRVYKIIKKCHEVTLDDKDDQQSCAGTNHEVDWSTQTGSKDKDYCKLDEERKACGINKRVATDYDEDPRTYKEEAQEFEKEFKKDEMLKQKGINMLKQK